MLLQLAGPVLAGDCFLPRHHNGHVQGVGSYGAGYGHVKAVNHHVPVKVVQQLIAVPFPVPYTYPVAAQGQTIYGYSTYGGQASKQLDLAVLLDRAERLASRSQDLSGQATSDFFRIVESERSDRADAAALRDAAVALRELVTASRRTDTATRELSGGSGSTATAQASTADAVLQSRCASCHDAFRESTALTAEQWAIVIDRVTHADPADRMPLASDRQSPGEPLTAAEKMLLLEAWKAASD